jgi:DNA replication protein DnaC
LFNSGVARRIGDMSSEMQKWMTFSNFNTRGAENATKEDRESLEKAKDAAYQFAGLGDNPEDRKEWILLSGPRGCGKTHLAVAIAGEQIKLEPDSVFFAFVPTLVDNIGSSFKPDKQIDYDELFEQISSVGMLILDDLYLESSVPWVEARLYQILVRRFEERLPTVITTSLNHKELHDLVPRIASRLVDVETVNWLTITAPNYRSQRRS